MHELMDFQRSGAYEKGDMGLTLETEKCGTILSKVGTGLLGLTWSGEVHALMELQWLGCLKKVRYGVYLEN